MYQVVNDKNAQGEQNAKYIYYKRNKKNTIGLQTRRYTCPQSLSNN